MLRRFARTSPPVRLAVAAFLLASTAGEATARMVARSASDLCPDDADPCVVSTQVIVPGKTTLDFDTRTLEIAEKGSLRLVREGIVIRAGRIVVAPRDGVAIRQVSRGSESVDVSIYSLRTCSAGAARCLEDDDCDLYGCGVHVCEGNPELQCYPGSYFDYCKLTCGSSGTCGDTDRTCQSDADCDFGPCGTGTVCSETTRAEGPLPCTTDADCQLGQCSVGDGSIEIDGEIRSRFSEYGGLWIDAAGTITMDAPVTLQSGITESWSDLVLDSHQDSVVVRGKILHQSDDAYTDVYSALDITLDGDLTMPGGGPAGYSGYFTAQPDRDLFLGGSINLSSRRGGLEGGTIDLWALGRLVVGGGDETKPVILRANGAGGRQLDEGGGPGGEIFLTGEQEVVVGPSVRLEALGGTPRAVGGGVIIDHSDRIVVAGELLVAGDSPTLRLDAGDIVIAESARLAVESPPEQEGGWIQLKACTLRVAGQLSLGSGLDTRRPYHVGGLEIRSGYLTLAGTSRITSDQAESPFLFQASGSMLAEAGSVVDNASGTNTIVYRDLGQAPVLSGLFTPAPNLTLDPSLVPCTP